jgi:hypothetical protein
MSLSNSSINVSQLLVFREILDLLSNPEAKKVLLSEAAEAFSKLQKKEAETLEALSKLAIVEARAAKDSKAAEELVAKAQKMMAEAHDKVSEASATVDLAKKVKSEAMKLKSDHESLLKEAAKKIEEEKTHLLRLQELCSAEKEKAAQAAKDYEDKAAKLKQALGG